VKTSKGEYTADKILLTIGRRGTPRKLGIPGEDLPKVVYRLIDPEQYINQKVLIVGGGDSALEAALAIADVEGSEVSLSYRSESFSRAKAKNRDKISHYAEQGKIILYLPSNLKSVEPDSMTLDYKGEILTLANDAIIINAGGILPTGFLKEIGIQVDTKYGTA
jgi:thioredoxin reductase